MALQLNAAPAIQIKDAGPSTITSERLSSFNPRKPFPLLEELSRVTDRLLLIEIPVPAGFDTFNPYR